MAQPGLAAYGDIDLGMPVDPESGTDPSFYSGPETYKETSPEDGAVLALAFPADAEYFIPPSEFGRPGDDKLTVEFYWGAAQGCDLIRIHTPGDPLTVAIFEADEHYQRRFAKQWAMYRAQVDQFADQTRLEEAAWIDEGLRVKLRPLGIFTLEHLAAVGDDNLRHLGPNGRGLRQRAAEQVMNSRKVKEFDGLRAENAELRTQLQQMSQATAELMTRLDALEAKEPGTHGKPKTKPKPKDDAQAEFVDG